MKTYAAVKKQFLKDAGTRRLYKTYEPEFALAQTIIQKRLKKGLTQAELARKIGTKQSAIARLESGNYNPSVELLARIANALNSRLEISIS